MPDGADCKTGKRLFFGVGFYRWEGHGHMKMLRVISAPGWLIGVGCRRAKGSAPPKSADMVYST